MNQHEMALQMMKAAIDAIDAKNTSTITYANGIVFASYHLGVISLHEFLSFSAEIDSKWAGGH